MAEDHTTDLNDRPHFTVAVIIPTYNRASFLPQAIGSLLNQTRVPDEIIVVDDGSTDHTPEILAHYDAPVIVIRQENQGRSAARNTGIEAVQSDLIAFLDSDDLLLPESIEKRARVLETHSDVGIVYCEVVVIDREGNECCQGHQFFSGPRPSGNVFALLAQKNFVPPIAYMIRRTCLDNVGLFDETLHLLEDYDLWLRLAERCNFRYLDEPLAYYRLHDAMSTRVQHAQLVTSGALIMERIRQMSAFAALTDAEKAAIYRAHGKQYAYMGRMADARHMFRQATRHEPHVALTAYGAGLWGLTWAGQTVFSTLLSIRGRLRGDLRFTFDHDS